MAEENKVQEQAEAGGQVMNCPGDCLRCSVLQRGYCASNCARSILLMMHDFSARFQVLEDGLRKLDAKLSAQGDTQAVFDPLSGGAEPLV